MSWQERVRWVGNHLAWNATEPDARVLQTAFSCTVLVVLGIRAGSGGLSGSAGWQVLAWLLTAVSAAVAITRPSLLRSALFRRGVAVLDIAVIGLLQIGPESGGIGPLVVLAALWLGLDYGLRGAALAFAATACFLSVPGVILHGTGQSNMERLVTLPLMAGVAASAITFGVRAARQAQARAEAHEEELAQTLFELERNRRSAHAIFEAVPIGMALLDDQGVPVLINHRLEVFSALAYPEGEHGPSLVFDESESVQLSLDEVPTSRARRGEEFDDARVWIGPEGAERRAMSISARRVADDQGNLWGAAISYADVTELMRALRIKDDFIALVSHELRTPLTPIVGYVSMVLERPDLDPLLRRQLMVVSRNAARLQRLVGDLLEEAQQSTGPVRLVIQATDLAEVARGCVANAEPNATTAGVALSLDAPCAVEYSGDPQRLGQVIDNLVSNAIKHTAAGGRVVVALSQGDDEVVVTVTDTGSGIAPADLTNIFNRFYRTEASTNAAIPGIGLGLSIAKSIVDSHGGRIELESQVGVGSVFRVVLPAVASRLAS